MGPSYSRDTAWTSKERSEEGPGCGRANDTGAGPSSPESGRVTLGRSGSQEFSVHPRCCLWEHCVRWFLFVFSLMSLGTHCSAGHPVWWPTSPKASSKAGLYGGNQPQSSSPLGFPQEGPRRMLGLHKFSPPIPPASGPTQGGAWLVFWRGSIVWGHGCI